MKAGITAMSLLRRIVDRVTRRKKRANRKNDASIYPMF
ncbi:hypothetical protein FRAAL4692 [Frankia alni ACN14a]|uniref:Uncharacterized protein n=1 Tax=Frankia alni (strain DSM 45986 / CECT 9034 / ACN14a) TaxID=326424 RepID=Q0RGQ2_FRAAA|nr:hypothetical protein FRAAL4692 [Frankia alni ACN14a]